MSPKASGKTQKSRLTADQILEAAARCIGSIGIEKTSITQIALEAGISRGLVAHYFPVKDELFSHVIRYIAKQSYLTLDSPPRDATPAEKILHNAQANLHFFLANPSYFKCLMLLYYYSTVRNDYRKLNTQLIKRAVSRIRQELQELTQSRSLVESSSQIDRRAETLHDELMAGIQKYFIMDHPKTISDYESEFIERYRGLIG